MARMCASVNVPRRGEPRCPLVPKLTSWLGSCRSGWRSKQAISRRATSINISLGAGLPASGEIVDSRGPAADECAPGVFGMILPSNVGCVFGDGLEAYHAMERGLLVR